MNPQSIEKLLVENGIIEPQKLSFLKEKASEEKLSLEDYLVVKKITTEKRILEIKSKALGVEYIDLSQIEIPKDVLFLIPEPLVRQHEIVAFKKTNDSLYVATTNPQDLLTQESIKKKTGLNIIPYLTTKSSIDSTLRLFKQSIKTKFDEILKTASKEQKGKTLEEIAKAIPVIRILDTLIDYAVLQDSSDIHVEPMEDQVLVRFRIDGVLHDIITLPRTIDAGIVARIKILSNLKIDEHRLPQDGRFTRQTEQYKASFRVSIIPVYDGEKVVMRILREEAKIITLEQLGLQHSALQIIKRSIALPYGMLLATGPTGSGKTTTLYSVINILNVPGVNISTVEDPIEYHIPRVSQTQILPRIGLTFSKGLRALMRQDPDIIMVGEIRDNETAEIAVHAALTGHIVLTTLHTNNAAGTLTRLIDMKVEPFLAASTINTAIGQRLVRKICPNCIESFKPDKNFLKSLSQNFNMEKIQKVLEREKIIMPGKKISDLKFYRGKGCDKCNKEGYKGRLGIFEVLEVTESIEELIIKKASTEEIQRKAVEQGMITMSEDGFIKAVTGITTIEEVIRVTREK